MTGRITRRAAVKSMVTAPCLFTILPSGLARGYSANEQVGIAVVGVSGRGSWFVGLLERDRAMRGVALGDVTEIHVWGGGNEPKGDGPHKGGPDLKAPAESQPVPPYLNWDLWLAGAAQRDYHDEWYGKWKRWRDFFTSNLGWGAPHSAALPFMAGKIYELWDAADVPSKNRSIRIVPTIPAVYTVGFPRWEIVRYEVPARGKLPPLSFTWHKRSMHLIEKALGDYPEWRDKRPKPWWVHGGSAFIGTKGKLNATHYGDTWEVYPAELGEADVLQDVRGDGHERQWLSAIRGDGETVSNFAISGPLTEFLMLGNVATLIGEPFTYDPVTGTVLDNEAAQAALHQEYREGWTL